MAEGPDVPEHGNIDSLILRSLVRTLVAKHILSADDVRGLLIDAATRLDVLGDEQTPQAARAMVEEDFLPEFLDDSTDSSGSP